MKTVDPFKRITLELLKALRGSKSQSWVNTKLKTTYNLVSRWENGQRRIYWDEFQQLIKVLKIDFDSSWSILLSDKVSRKNKSDFFRLLVDPQGIEKTKKALKVSDSTLYRWMRKEQAPPLDVVIHLAFLNGLLHRLIESLTEIESVPTIAKARDLHKRARQLFAQYPIASPILLYMETDEFQRYSKYDRGTIAKRFGLTLKAEDKILKELVATDLVTYENSKYSHISNYIDLGWSNQKDLNQLHKIEKFWISTALQSYKEKSSSYSAHRNTIGFQAFAADEDILIEVKKELGRFYHRLHQILEQEATGEIKSVHVLSYQLLDL